MTRKKLNKTIIHIILLAFAAAALPACDDLYHSAQKQIKNSKSFSFLATILRAAPAPYQAQGLSFSDAHPEENTIGGNIIIQPAKDESLVQFYWAYYGSSPTTMLDEEFGGFYIAQCIPNYNGTPAVMSIPNTGMPIGATHILIYSVDFDFNMLPRPTALRIHDMVLRPIDIFAGNSSFPAFLTAYNGRLYFSADGGTGYGRKLWAYDGPPYAPVEIDGISDYINPEYLQVYNNQLYFSAEDNIANYDPLVCGNELFRYDDIILFNVENVCDINADANSSTPRNLKSYDGKLFFQATDSSIGSELRLYTGTPPTGMPPIAFDIDSRYDTVPYSSLPENITGFNGRTYFTATREDVGRELFYYDDGMPFPQPVWDLNLGANGSFPSDLAVYNGSLFFVADRGDGLGRQLQFYDGVPGHEPIAIAVGWALDPANLIVYHNKLYFRGSDGAPTAQYELWAYSPQLHIHLALNVDNDAASSYPSNMVVYDDRLYFSAASGAINYLWMFDDREMLYTSSNPQVVGWATVGARDPQFLRVFNNGIQDILCMQASDGAEIELWEHYIK